MPSNPNLLLSAFRRRWSASLLTALVLCLGADERIAAQAPYANEQTPEGWAWAQIKQGKEANLNDRCNTPALDPRAENDGRWTDGCRRISSAFLVDVLTNEPWRGQVPIFGVHIVGGRIEGDINLHNAKLNRAFSIKESRIENDINLPATRTDGFISISRSLVSGKVYAIQLHGELSLSLVGSEFKNDVALTYAKIDGYVEMEGATFDGELIAAEMQVGSSLFMRTASFNKAVNLKSANVTLNVFMHGASFNGKLDAEGLQVGGYLFMRDGASFKDVHLTGAKIAGDVQMDGAGFKDVSLTGAKVAGNVNMDYASFDGEVDAEGLQVGGYLSMSTDGHDKASFKDVNLKSAKVTGDIEMGGATFAGQLNADLLQVGGHLSMSPDQQNKASFKGVSLLGAKVTGDFEMEGASFAGELNADSLQVGGHLTMSTASFKEDVKLTRAKVTGDVNMDGAAFDGKLDADAMAVEGSVFMRGSTYADRMTIAFAHIGGNLDLRGATLTNLDLSGSSISGDLRLGPSENLHLGTIWREKPGLEGGFSLRNARVSSLVDRQENAWPFSERMPLDLDGFRFVSIMRDRRTDWWDTWARQDPNYSPAPYDQLAAAFVAMGDRDAADEIHYLGRVREREAEVRWWPWIVSGLFQYTAGFGIGAYPFRVVWWVFGMSLAGAVYLWTCVTEARKHGPIWCFGASLGRLLPVIEINKEFTDFFDDPERKRLTAWQSLVFSVVGLFGWFLGAILIAAVSGLTQKL